VRRLALLVSVLSALLAGLTACASKTDGSAVAGGEPAGNLPTTTTRSGRPPTTSNANPGNGSLPRDPCSLLTAQAQAQLGISGGERSDVGSARGCKWRLRGPEETYFFSIDLRDSVGIKDIPSTSNPKPLSNVGSHKAVQVSGVGGPGSCSVALGVGDSSTVTQSVTAGTNLQKACELALQMARLVEPELP
jgi:hypothetical protein